MRTTHPPQLLFLCQTLPFPPDGGANIRAYNVLRLLSQSFDITALCFYRRATLSTSDLGSSLRALRTLAEVEAFPIPQEHSRIRLITDHIRSLVTRRVYTVQTYRSRAFQNRLADLLRSRHFDLVHVDSLDLSAYLPLVAPLPTVVAHHNIESSLLAQRAESERSRLRRWYLHRQAAFMESEERRWAPRVALNVTVSEADHARLLKMVPGASVTVVPNGVDTAALRPANSTDKALVFVGGLDWFPNRDALQYFCDEILHLLKARHPDLKVDWIGRIPDTLRATFHQYRGVQLVGYVDDIRPHVQRAACYIVPLRLGGGTRLKILDAWALGKAVVSTSAGCDGLDARDGENILIRDTPPEFADAVHSVLSDSALRTSLELGARSTALNSYDWEIIGKHMLGVYRQLLPGGRVLNRPGPNTP